MLYLLLHFRDRHVFIQRVSVSETLGTRHSFLLTDTVVLTLLTFELCFTLTGNHHQSSLDHLPFRLS
jgi:hypothetical protein